MVQEIKYVTRVVPVGQCVQNPQQLTDYVDVYIYIRFTAQIICHLYFKSVIHQQTRLLYREYQNSQRPDLAPSLEINRTLFTDIIRSISTLSRYNRHKGISNELILKFSSWIKNKANRDNMARGVDQMGLDFEQLLSTHIRNILYSSVIRISKDIVSSSIENFISSNQQMYARVALRKFVYNHIIRHQNITEQSLLKLISKHQTLKEIFEVKESKERVSDFQENSNGRVIIDSIVSVRYFYNQNAVTEFFNKLFNQISEILDFKEFLWNLFAINDPTGFLLNSYKSCRIQIELLHIFMIFIQFINMKISNTFETYSIFPLPSLNKSLKGYDRTEFKGEYKNEFDISANTEIEYNGRKRKFSSLQNSALKPVKKAWKETLDFDEFLFKKRIETATEKFAGFCKTDGKMLHLGMLKHIKNVEQIAIRHHSDYVKYQNFMIPTIRDISKRLVVGVDFGRKNPLAIAVLNVGSTVPETSHLSSNEFSKNYQDRPPSLTNLKKTLKNLKKQNANGGKKLVQSIFKQFNLRLIFKKLNQMYSFTRFQTRKEEQKAKIRNFLKVQLWVNKVEKIPCSVCFVGGAKFNRYNSHITMAENILNEFFELVVKVPEYNTSKTCSILNCLEKGDRKGEEFYCPYCQKEQHADENAAKNIILIGKHMVTHGVFPEMFKNGTYYYFIKATKKEKIITETEKEIEKEIKNRFDVSKIRYNTKYVEYFGEPEEEGEIVEGDGEDTDNNGSDGEGESDGEDSEEESEWESDGEMEFYNNSEF